MKKITNISAVLIFVGTRPEALKLVMLYRLLKERGVNVKLCVTGQHADLIAGALEPFEVLPDIVIDLDRKSSDLNELTALLFEKLGELLKSERPKLSIVQGDTTTALVAGMASFYNLIPVFHVEAGLRTSRISLPFPEEFNRRIISTFSSVDFAPTDAARIQLIREGKDPRCVYMVGNTIVDALKFVASNLDNIDYFNKHVSDEVRKLSDKSNLILFTCHRRESIGNPMKSICEALRKIAKNNQCEIIFPCHPNPIVQKIFTEELNGFQNIHFLNPQNYPSFVKLLLLSRFVITDSGGVQEECATLGIPFVVTRNETERPEALLNSEFQLVGTDPDRIYDASISLLRNKNVCQSLRFDCSPFGDGTSSMQIIQTLLDNGVKAYE